MMGEPLLLQLILFALASSPGEDLDHAKLAAAIKNGDNRAFKTFFEKHYEPLFRFLRSKNVDPQTAEDLIQQAFVYIWEHRSGIDPQKSLRAYLFKIAYTRMLNHLRDNKKFDESEAVPTRESELTPEDEARARELEQAITEAIEAMPEKRSRVFELCFMEQLTYREAAEVLDISSKTVENHMGLAFKDLRAALQIYL